MNNANRLFQSHGTMITIGLSLVLLNIVVFSLLDYLLAYLLYIYIIAFICNSVAIILAIKNRRLSEIIAVSFLVLGNWLYYFLLYFYIIARYFGT